MAAGLCFKNWGPSPCSQVKSTEGKGKDRAPCLVRSPEEADLPTQYNPSRQGPREQEPEAQDQEPLLSPPHTRSGSEYGEKTGPRGTPTVLPLREGPLMGANPGGQPFMVYVPFSTSDLYNWKAQNPPFSEKPQALISLLESVFQTHKPTRDDCQELLTTLFTSEERE